MYKFWTVVYSPDLSGYPRSSVYHGLKTEDEFEVPQGWHAVGVATARSDTGGVVLLLERDDG